MPRFFSDLLAGQDLLPHGYCLNWGSSLLWTTVVSDVIIALAYYSIPISLVYFVRQRRDLPYPWLFLMFGIFILACGTTHLVSVLTIWLPAYWLDAWVKVFTAGVSVTAAVAMLWVIPRALQLPSPEQLKAEIQRREQVQRQLEASEKRQRAIFEAEPDAMLISDEQGMIVMANWQAGMLLNYTTDELVGRSIEQLVPEPFRAMHRLHYQRYTTAPQARPMGSHGKAFMAQRKDGSQVAVEISLSPIATDEGLLFASALRDVTERKRAEEELRASEARFRRMADCTPVMIWTTDAKGTPTFNNRAWLNFVGMDAGNINFHEDWLKTIHPDDIGKLLTAYENAVDPNTLITLEYRLRRWDGKWRWVLDSGTPLCDEHGELTGYIGSAIDISERKQAEIELRIAAVAFEAQEAIVITDSDNVILRVNRAFSESTGYSAEEAVGNKINLLRSGRHDAAFYDAMWETIRRTGSWQGEIWDRRKNGEIYPKWLTITAIADAAGSVTHYVGIQTDISERKAEEEQMRNLAYYDALTQLPNRRLLCERIEHGIRRAVRENRQMAVLILDLDRFKPVNDQYGHLAGDELLQQVAARLTARLREVDTVARLGGDEFTVLLESISEAGDAGSLAEAIVEALRRPFQVCGNIEVAIGASVGIALYPQHGGSYEVLMEKADAALYQAKTAGRGCYAYFSGARRSEVGAKKWTPSNRVNGLMEDRDGQVTETVVHGGLP